MRRYVEELQLSPRWWWGTVAAVFVVALLFVAAGSVAAALVCFACAVAIGALALSMGASGSREPR